METAWGLPFGTLRRNPYDQAAGVGAGDIVGIPGVHIEVKRCKSPRLSGWMSQLRRDCPAGDIPVLLFRLDGDTSWRMQIDAKDYARLHRRVSAASKGAWS